MAHTFVIGDIHGAYRALRQCLERSGFDHEKDLLIFLGDVVDGWPETRECIDELLKVRNLVCLLGNHDQWALEWMQNGTSQNIWLQQGGKATVDSYRDGVPSEHRQFLENAQLYYLNANRLFVHAGFDPKIPLSEQGPDTFLWDRTLARTALYFHREDISVKLTGYDEVFVGHTPVTELRPVKACEVWLMDTGAGWSGVLSMMNLDTREIFTSDRVPLLYPGTAGRHRIH